MLIQVKELSQTDQGNFLVELSFDQKKHFKVEIINLHDKQTEKNLEWYFEQYIEEPYTAETKALSQRKHIVDYGIQLFEQLFAEPEALRLFKEASKNGKNEDITFEIISQEGATEFQSILWEALRQPELKNSPLIDLGMLFYRRSLKSASMTPFVGQHHELNLLIVTARPDEEHDIGYRTIQRPMIDMIVDSGVPVKPFILRPGTYKALKEHLMSVKSGHYHIIHFDLHGGVRSYEELQNKKKAGKMHYAFNHSFGKTPQLFQNRYDRIDLEKFDGKKAFLFFESEIQGKAEPASAVEIAELIQKFRIPVCILNACQSAKQDGQMQETSLAKVLQEHGVNLVLAMRYSVSLTAASKLMEIFYDQLFKNNSLGEAISLARRQLYSRKNRVASLGYNIELEDWVLLVIYQREEVNFSIQERTKEEKKPLYAKRNKQIRFPEFPYGFHGRDLDILKIEKLLLPPDNHLLLRSMIGIGKSALLRYLAAWWTVTNYRNIFNAFYFDFKAQSYSPEQFIGQLASQLSDKYKPESMENDGLVYWLEEVLGTLKRDPYALILDNIFEFSDEIIIDFLSRLKGKSFVVYGSVNEEERLKPLTFKNNVYQLDGLDKDATHQLASKIIKIKANKDIQKLFKEDKFSLDHLLRLLAGFPGAMEKVLPQLKDKTATEVLQDFRNGTLAIDF